MQPADEDGLVRVEVNFFSYGLDEPRLNAADDGVSPSERPPSGWGTPIDVELTLSTAGCDGETQSITGWNSGIEQSLHTRPSVLSARSTPRSLAEPPAPPLLSAREEPLKRNALLGSFARPTLAGAPVRDVAKVVAADIPDPSAVPLVASEAPAQNLPTSHRQRRSTSVASSNSGASTPRLPEDVDDGTSSPVVERQRPSIPAVAPRRGPSADRPSGAAPADVERSDEANRQSNARPPVPGRKVWRQRPIALQDDSYYLRIAKANAGLGVSSSTRKRAIEMEAAQRQAEKVNELPGRGASTGADAVLRL